MKCPIMMLDVKAAVGKVQAVVMHIERHDLVVAGFHFFDASVHFIEVEPVPIVPATHFFLGVVHGVIALSAARAFYFYLLAFDGYRAFDRSWPEIPSANAVGGGLSEYFIGRLVLGLVVVPHREANAEMDQIYFYPRFLVRQGEVPGLVVLADKLGDAQLDRNLIFRLG